MSERRDWRAGVVILIVAAAWLVSKPSVGQEAKTAQERQAAKSGADAGGLEELERLVNEAARADRAGDGDRLLKAVEQAFKTKAEGGQDLLASAYYFRGRERFRRNEIEGAVKDFDKQVELAPRREPSQWERGIAFYYAGQFERGAKQFELYQTFDARDVENSVWRYLCMARSVGVAKAREAMLPIEQDRRVGMMEIYELYRGKSTPEKVSAVCRSDDPAEGVLAGRLFYAHLYLGLYFEVEGKAEQAERYIRLAADEKLRGNPVINSYMWAVADVHAKRMKKSSNK
ncbi:MAG TPA: hypothetical protein PLV92_08315 [Pirellulaceae bacterium]|nr:hypothetical protein [Pirellulaceae bacterium]